MEQLPIMGTFEPNALIMSNRTDQDLTSLHSFGIHCIPHIGVYGEHYSIALPIVLLSIQPTLSVLNQIPSDPLSALNINLQSIYESSLRDIARDIVAKVLTSSSKYVNNLISWRSTENRNNTDFHYQVNDRDDDEVERIVTNNSIDVISCDSLIVSDIEEIENDISGYKNEDEFFRKLAHKLVRKIIHAAYTRLDPLSRADSIDELVTNTKRVKITFSPSYTPPLEPIEIKEPSCQLKLAINKIANERGSVSPNQLSAPNSGLFSIGTQAGCIEDSSNNRKKRQRSASHEANMEKDMEKIRYTFKSKLQISIDCEDCDNQVKPSIDETLTTNQRRSVTDTITDIRKLSIMEVAEQDKDEEDDSNYTILEAVTKPTVTPFPDVPITMEDSNINGAQDTTSSTDHFLSSFPVSPTIPQVYPHSSVVNDLDYYIVIHSFPPTSQCQKFLCNNENEVNLMFHCWHFKDMPYDPTISATEQMDMGVFEPEGVSPIHLDLVDGGVSFYYMEPRTVCIHGSCFSPENAQLQLPVTTNNFRSFFSVGSNSNRRVITYHVLPTSKHVEGLLSRMLQECDGSLLKFTEILSCNFPDLAKIIIHLIKPIL